MFGKGVETFHFLDQFTTQFDPDNKGVLLSHFFNLFLNKVGVFLSTQEIRNIRDLYAVNKGITVFIQVKTSFSIKNSSKM